MKLFIFISKECGNDYCAGQIAKLIKKKPNACLGLATGTTFIPTYKELVNMYKVNNLDFSKIKTFNLDEYINCQGEEKISYRYFMQEQLFNHINICQENTHFPDSINPNEKSLKAYDDKIAKTGIDLQLLGVGRNGHIAFNEPTKNTFFNTHVVNLSETTIKDNAKLFFNNKIAEVPKQAVSMGISNILSAKKIIIAAYGEAKAEAIAKFCASSKIDSYLPISYLNQHKNVELILDKEAAKKIDLEHLKANIEVEWF